MTELLSTGILKDDRTNQYLGKNDKGKFKYNKNEYGSDKAFIIDLQDENDDKEEYLDDNWDLIDGSYETDGDKNILKSEYIKEDSITNMSKSDVQEILAGVNDGVEEDDKTNFLLIKVDGQYWDESKMSSYKSENIVPTEDEDYEYLTIYLDKVTFAPCENWTLQGRYDNYDEDGFIDDNDDEYDGKYFVYSPQDKSQKVVIELNEYS